MHIEAPFQFRLNALALKYGAQPKIQTMRSYGKWIATVTVGSHSFGATGCDLRNALEFAVHDAEKPPRHGY